jgi:hypothetical protein
MRWSISDSQWCSDMQVFIIREGRQLFCQPIYTYMLTSQPKYYGKTTWKQGFPICECKFAFCERKIIWRFAKTTHKGLQKRLIFTGPKKYLWVRVSDWPYFFCRPYYFFNTIDRTTLFSPGGYQWYNQRIPGLSIILKNSVFQW